MRRLLYLIPVVVFAAVGIGLAVGLTRDPGTLPSALVDRPVPQFELPALEGADGLSDADLKGRVSLVNVFASWCVPCRVEHPVLMRLAEQGVPIFGINYKDPPDQAKAWLAELGDPFGKIGADRNGRVGIEWGVYGVPETFVIDAEGRIRHRHVGPIQARDLEQTLLPILAELAP
jgi:cytochrome c biogenesis protein CcmG, thiol:disulfide interchange protein DsbE